MDAGLLRALKTVKDNRYVQYVGIGLAGLVTQEDHVDKETGKPKRKNKYQLIRISAAVCGIELCYAAETAFVSPILLKLGVPPSLMTLVWCLSPIIGFFLVPVMGSLSDRCRLKIGRRRPFIIILSLGIILGLALVPNGQDFGVLLGDTWKETPVRIKNTSPAPNAAMANFIILSLNSSITGAFPNQSSSSYYLSNSISAQHRFYNDSPAVANGTVEQSKPLSFSVPTEHLRGIILTILGVTLLDFNCDACQSPCRAYLLDVSVPEDHSQGLTMFTVMAGAGGAVGYVMGGIDWNSTGFGEAFGGHIRVVFTIVLVAFLICVISTLTSFKETPLSEINITAEKLQRKSKKKENKKYKKFTNEEDSSSEEEKYSRNINYGTISETTQRNPKIQNTDKKLEFVKESGANTIGQDSTSNKTNSNKGPEVDIHANRMTSSNEEMRTQTFFRAGKADQISDESAKSQCLLSGSGQLSTQPADLRAGNGRPNVCDGQVLSVGLDKNNTHHLQMNGHITKTSHISNTDHSSFVDPTTTDLNPYSTMHSDVFTKNDDITAPIGVLEVSTDVTLKTYLKSIVHMPKCLWILCLTNLFCWMSLVCYSLYFTDFVGQAVFRGNPLAPSGSIERNLYDQGIRLGSMGMSLYSLSCACYSLVIEKLVQRFRAKRVYVVGQLVYTVGMLVMAVSKSEVAVILMSPTAGVMYATLFTMPYLLVAHYHARGMFSQSSTLNGEERQVRGLGTDVAIISSMVFLAQFLLSVIMGTAVSVVGSTITVVVTSSILSFLGALTATQVTYLDL